MDKNLDDLFEGVEPEKGKPSLDTLFEGVSTNNSSIRPLDKYESAKVSVREFLSPAPKTIRSVGTAVSDFFIDSAEAAANNPVAATVDLAGQARPTKALKAATQGIPFVGKATSAMDSAVGIGLSTVAREVDDAAGFSSRDKGVFENFADATFEALGAKAATKLLGLPIINKLKPKKTLTEGIQVDDVPSEGLFGGVKASDVEKELFDETEVFLASERTRGAIGKEATDKTVRSALRTQEAFGTLDKYSALAERNKTIQETLKRNIRDGKAIAPKQVADGFITAADKKSKAWESQIDFYAKDMGESLQRNIPLQTTPDPILDALRASRVDLDETFGYGYSEKQLTQLNDILKAKEGAMQAEDLNKFITEAWNKANKDQAQAVYFKHMYEKGIRPVLEAEAATGSVYARSAIKRFDLIGQKYKLENESPAYKWAKGFKEATPNSHIKKLLIDSELRKDVVATFGKSGDGSLRALPEMLEGVIQDEFIDPVSGNISQGGITKVYQTYGREVLQEVLGSKRLRTLDLIAASQQMLESNAAVARLAETPVNAPDIGEAVREVVQISTQATAAAGAIPTTQPTGFLTVLTKPLRRIFGITDAKKLKEAMRDPVMRKFMEMPLDDPASYYYAKTAVQSLARQGIAANFTREEFYESVDETNNLLQNKQEIDDVKLKMLAEEISNQTGFDIGKDLAPTEESGGSEVEMGKSFPNIEKDVKNFESRNDGTANDEIGQLIQQGDDVANTPKSIIGAAATDVGVDADILIKIAQAESSLNPDAKARTSSAGGLFQFIDSTWKDMVKRHGDKYGITVADKFDPRANSIMGAIFTQENANRLKPVLGREPNAREVYLAHFSGAGTAKKVLAKMKQNPNAPASEAWGSAAIKANKSIFYNNGKLRTVEEVFNRLTNKVA